MFKFKSHTSTTRIINGSLDSIPWEEAYNIYENAAQQELTAYRAARTEKFYSEYQQERQRRILIQEQFNPEAGSFEGDVDLEFSEPPMSTDEIRRVRQHAGDAALAEHFIKAYQLKSFGMRVVEEALVLYKNHKLNKAGEGGTICGKQYLLDNFNPQDRRALGLYRFLQFNQRSAWLGGPATKEGKRFCGLVPLILYAHKLYNNTPYSSWSRETLHYVVNSQLAEAMLCEPPAMSIERTLELRDLGLTSRGERRSAVTTYMLYNLKGTELDGLNALARIMVLQTWCAHPQNRTKYMVLDPKNWDAMPPPLASSSPFTKPDFHSPTTVPSQSIPGINSDDMWLL